MAPIAALGLVVLVVSLLASSDLMPRATRPAEATPRTTTATTIIEFQLPAAEADAAQPSAGSDLTTDEGGEGTVDDGSVSSDGTPVDATAGSGSGDGPGAAGDGDTGTEAAEGTYTVEAGDSPYLIAQKFGVSTQLLMEVNGITDPTDLKVGAVLTIPAE